MALATFLAIAGTDAAVAADYKIPSQTKTFDCGKVKPGDTITIPAGARNPLTIAGCTGTSANPIIVRNDPSGSGPAVIRRTSGSSGGFIFSCNHCTNVEIDGSYKWKGAPQGRTYGLKFTLTGGSEPTAFLRVAGVSRFVTIRNVEIEGVFPQRSSTGIGISINDHSMKRSKYPTFWREGYLIEDNYIHNVSVSGMYIGPNDKVGEPPLRDIEIRGNLIEDTGFEAINTKSMWAGDNSIHHNTIRRAGLSTSKSNDASQYSGITNNSGKVDIYNNWIEATGSHGIQVWTSQGPKITEKRGPFPTYIWNNVIVDAGKLWKAFMQNSYGINVGAQDGTEKPIPYVFNNTIVDSRQRAINIGSNAGSGGYVRDNIVAGSNFDAVRAPGFVKVSNNLITDKGQAGFVDPARLNFHLSASSDARNAGSAGYPQIDFDDVTRPKGGAPDQGAYEATIP